MNLKLLTQHLQALRDSNAAAERRAAHYQERAEMLAKRIAQMEHWREAELSQQRRESAVLDHEHDEAERR